MAKIWKRWASLLQMAQSLSILLAEDVIFVLCVLIAFFMEEIMEVIAILAVLCTHLLCIE
jgi:hypothetical protein